MVVAGSVDSTLSVRRPREDEKCARLFGLLVVCELCIRRLLLLGLGVSVSSGAVINSRSDFRSVILASIRRFGLYKRYLFVFRVKIELMF